eukprot:16243727-Heterocapsa_arctica.AAC.1
MRRAIGPIPMSSSELIDALGRALNRAVSSSMRATRGACIDLGCHLRPDGVMPILGPCFGGDVAGAS